MRAIAITIPYNRRGGMPNPDMTNAQLYLAVGVPMLFNALLIGILLAHMNSRFDGMQRGFDQRFDDMRDLWRAELHRVEEVLDARLKHLEER
jgi:hypothetical protein